MRVLGVNGSGPDLWVALYGDDGPESTDPVKLSLPDGTEGGYALNSFRTTVEHTLREWSPEIIVILNPRSPTGDPPWRRALPRISAETMLVLAATACDIPVERVAPGSIQSKLALGKSGGLREHAKKLLPVKVGTHWAGKRDLAALAAASRHPNGLPAC